MAFSRTKHIRRYCTERRCQIRKRLTGPLKANPIKKSCKIYDMTVGEEDTTDHRPVYILGAGFSKAICNEIPLLNALGQQALNLLPKASRESIRTVLRYPILLHINEKLFAPRNTSSTEYSETLHIMPAGICCRLFSRALFLIRINNFPA